jgi:ring-1,2-phenylacetyl-CoA epoxidase subunit PaaE
MEPKSRVSLIYGNRTVESILFWKKLTDMELADRQRLNVVHVLSKPTDSWAGYRGRINKANIVVMLKELDIHFRSKNEEFYLCGPAGMMQEVLEIFDVFNVPAEQIHRENFNTPMLGEELPLPETDGLKTREVTVKYDGDDYTFKVEPHQTILEAALELDIDLPYSCQAGMCTACLGKCTSGKIKMDEDEGLTQKEKEEGWVLTCVAHPLTEGVVLEID